MSGRLISSGEMQDKASALLAKIRNIEVAYGPARVDEIDEQADDHSGREFQHGSSADGLAGAACDIAHLTAVHQSGTNTIACRYAVPAN